MTQKELVLEMLQSGNWMSTLDFVHCYILRGPARIHELRQEGYEIESRKVAGKSYDEYRLVKDKVVECVDEKDSVAQKVYFHHISDKIAQTEEDKLIQDLDTTDIRFTAQNLGTLQENNQKTLW